MQTPSSHLFFIVQCRHNSLHHLLTIESSIQNGESIDFDLSCSWNVGVSLLVLSPGSEADRPEGVAGGG